MSTDPQATGSAAHRGLLENVLDRPVSVSIAALALVVLGVVSLTRLPVSLLPSLERPRLEVRLADADRGRGELLQEVVRPLERRLASLPGVLDVLSQVGDGEAVVRVETEWQTDVDRLRIDAERRLADVAVGGLDDLSVRVASGDAEPILRLAIRGGGGAHARTELAEKVLVPELGRLPGAGDIRLAGTSRLHPVVRPRAADLAARGLTAADIARRLDRVGRDVPLGVVRHGSDTRPLVVREPVRRLQELAALRLELPASPSANRGQDTDDAPRLVTLADIADVRLEAVADASVARYGGRDVVLVELHRAPGANAVLLARAAREVVAELAPRAGGGLEIVAVDDASAEVVAALAGLGQAALAGLLLGTLVLRFLLGSWRPTLSLAVVVPASMIAAFAAFHLGGISLDLVSLAGLALAAGMLVDNSIVVLESIAASRDRGDADPVAKGTRQIAMALVASFLTTAVVFLPLVYLRGLARAFFGVQAFAIVSSLAISLALSLSLTPVLARLGARRSRPAETQQSAPRRRSQGRSPGRDTYLSLLRVVLRRPGVTLLATVLLLGLVALLLPGLPRELVPAGPGHGLHADLRMEPGLETTAAGERLRALEQALATDPDSASIPADSLLVYFGEDTADAEAGEGLLESSLDPSNESETSGLVAERIQGVPGVEAEVRTQRGAVSTAVERSGRRVEVEVSASTPERTTRLAARVQGRLADAGFEATPVRRSGRPIRGLAGHRAAYRLSWRPLFAGDRQGQAALVEQVRAGLGGSLAGRTEIVAAEPAILLEATRVAGADAGPGEDAAASAHATDPALLPIRLAGDGAGSVGPGRAGGPPRVVPLAAVAHIEPGYLAPADERRNGRPTVRLALPRSTDVAQLEAVLAALRAEGLEVDERVVLAGETRELRRAFAQLRLALGLALILVFLTVAALYESLALPLAVMTTVPVAAAGALAALAATGDGLNVMSLLGLVLLTGIVVNNGIVLIHRVEQLRAAGLCLVAAVEEGAGERYRPILMTTLTTLLGMLPLALLGGEGAELRRSLATAVCGGLVTSWAGALLVVPAFYRLLRKDSPAESDLEEADLDEADLDGTVPEDATA